MSRLEEEYKTHELPKELKEQFVNPYYLILSIDELVKEWEKEEKIAIRKRRKNQIIQKILVREKDILQREQEYLEQYEELLEDNMDFMIEILETITEDNYLELARLVDFIVTQYINNKGFFQSRIEGLNQALRGIQYVDNRYQLTHKELKELVEKILSKMKKEKQLEKKQDV